MADVKISGLPASSVPLAGTEVLPIVQGGQTRQVSVNNLTTGKALNATQYTSTIATGTAPLVVASTTEVANLRAANATSADTANQVKSNATTGVLQVAGPGTGTTRVMTTPNANFTAARTDAAQTFTGIQSFSEVNTTGGVKNTSAGSDTASAPDGFYFTDGAFKNAILQLGTSGQLSTFVFEPGGAGWRRVAALLRNGDSVVDVGNLVIGTSGKGIDFSATPGAGTSELLADYEEGTWTPTQGAGLTVVGAFSSSGRYIKVGKQVTLLGNVTGATSIAYAAAGAPLTAGAPFDQANEFGIGGAFVGTFTTTGANTLISGTSIYADTNMSGSTVIYFQITYFTT
jgi:hypothetical protein